MSQLRDFPDKMPFRVIKPTLGDKPYLFNSPHSGRSYPKAFMQMSGLDDFDIRLSEDRFVDEIFGNITQYGATLMCADFPRAYLDVNRDACELDANMFEGEVTVNASPPSLRVEAGFGVVPRIVASAKPIYDRKLPLSEALERINSIYHPYHDCLNHQLQQLRRRYGLAILIDCHSMPSHLRCSSRQPDFVLGDVHNRSCAGALTDYAEELLTGFGYHVVRNRPYAGGYITTHYGRPFNNIHALQIEINRDLYLTSRKLEKNSNFTAFSEQMVEFGRRLMRIDHEILLLRQAAE